MQINIYTIAKKDAQVSAIINGLCMQCRQFGAKVKLNEIFPASVQKAHKISPSHAQASYTQAFMPYIMSNTLNIALHPSGKSLDSESFAKLFETHAIVQFFIGGAYGFEEGFLNMCQSISLSKLTLSHKIAQIVLCEQIYRALSILNAHPYHK